MQKFPVCGILLIGKKKKGGKGVVDMQKLLIADGNEEFRLALAEALRDTYIVRVCQEGKEALRQLQTFRPDVLVLDLVMAELDGISLLQKAAQMDLRPVVLATTRFRNDYVLERAAQLGVGYVMIQPCDLEAVKERLADLTERTEAPAVTQADSRTTASNLLLSLGIPTKLKGYTFLREALLLVMRDPRQSVTKELYPAVAEICGGNAFQVERAIRSAICTAWNRRDDRQWRVYFQPGPDGSVPRPTNAAFISRLADRMMLCMEIAE